MYILLSNKNKKFIRYSNWNFPGKHELFCLLVVARSRIRKYYFVIIIIISTVTKYLILTSVYST